MRFIVFLLLILANLSLNAQNFTQRLTAIVQGQGKVTLTQDPRLTDIINGNGVRKTTPQRPTNMGVASGGTTSSAGTVSQTTGQDVDPTLPSVPVGKKVKVRGYRVQVYWGGNSKSDQTKAQTAGIKVQESFPELGIYTSFESPHWRCRVGDFMDRQEAYDYLVKLRAAGLVGEGMIVKSEIFVYQ